MQESARLVQFESAAMEQAFVQRILFFLLHQLTHRRGEEAPHVRENCEAFLAQVWKTLKSEFLSDDEMIDAVMAEVLAVLEVWQGWGAAELPSSESLTLVRMIVARLLELAPQQLATPIYARVRALHAELHERFDISTQKWTQLSSSRKPALPPAFTTPMQGATDRLYMSLSPRHTVTPGPVLLSRLVAAHRDQGNAIANFSPSTGLIRTGSGNLRPMSAPVTGTPERRLRTRSAAASARRFRLSPRPPSSRPSSSRLKLEHALDTVADAAPTPLSATALVEAADEGAPAPAPKAAAEPRTVSPRSGFRALVTTITGAAEARMKKIVVAAAPATTAA